MSQEHLNPEIQAQPIANLEKALTVAEKNLKITFPSADELFRFILSPEAPLSAWGIAVPRDPKNPIHREAVKTYSVAEAKEHFYHGYREDLLSKDKAKSAESWRQLKPLFQHEASTEAQNNWQKLQESINSDPKKRNHHQAKVKKSEAILKTRFEREGRQVSGEDLTKLAEGRVQAGFLRRSQSSIETRMAKKVDKKIKGKMAKEGGRVQVKRVLESLITKHGSIKHAQTEKVAPGVSRADGRYFMTAYSVVETWKGARWMSPLTIEEPMQGMSKKDREQPVGIVTMCMYKNPQTGEVMVDAGVLEQPGTFVQGNRTAIGPGGQTSVSNYAKADIIGGPNTNGKPTIDILIKTSLSPKKKDRQKAEGMIHLLSEVGNPGRLSTSVLGGVVDVNRVLESHHFDETQKKQLRDRKYYNLAEITRMIDDPARKGKFPIASSFFQELLRKVWELQVST